MDLWLRWGEATPATCKAQSQCHRKRSREALLAIHSKIKINCSMTTLRKLISNHSTWQNRIRKSQYIARDQAKQQIKSNQWKKLLFWMMIRRASEIRLRPRVRDLVTNQRSMISQQVSNEETQTIYSNLRMAAPKLLVFDSRKSNHLMLGVLDPAISPKSTASSRRCDEEIRAAFQHQLRHLQIPTNWMTIWTLIKALQMTRRMLLLKTSH